MRYLLGRASDVCGDRVGMTHEWGLVLGLDAAAAPPQPLMAEDEFESVAEAALAELPQELLDQLRRVSVLVADRPSAEMVADGIDPRILGLYHGVPMTRRSISFGAPFADTICRHDSPFSRQPGACLRDSRRISRAHPHNGAARNSSLLRLHGRAAPTHGTGMRRRGLE